MLDYVRPMRAVFFLHARDYVRDYVQRLQVTRDIMRGGKVSLTVAGKAVTFRFLSKDEIQQGGKVQGRNKKKGRAGARRGK